MSRDIGSEIDTMLESKIREDAAVTHTRQELESTAKWLLSWANRTAINKVGYGTVLYRKGGGRNSTKLYPRMVDALLKEGLATGTMQSFTMVADKVKALP